MPGGGGGAGAPYRAKKQEPGRKQKAIDSNRLSWNTLQEPECIRQERERLFGARQLVDANRIGLD